MKIGFGGHSVFSFSFCAMVYWRAVSRSIASDGLNVLVIDSVSDLPLIARFYFRRALQEKLARLVLSLTSTVPTC
jgi:hypothetical protein